MVKFNRLAPGYYVSTDQRFVLQQPHSCDPNDPDRQWYLFDSPQKAGPNGGTVHGPFDTKKEAVTFAQHC